VVLGIAKRIGQSTWFQTTATIQTGTRMTALVGVCQHINESRFDGEIAMNEKKRSLVTGGAGFMGSHVADHLLAMGHEVTVLDDLSGGFSQNVPTLANFVQGSITDYNLINNLFDRHSFHYVYHLAAYAAEGLSHFIKRFNYNNNLIGSVNLINAAINHQVQCFVFTSSIAVYGEGQSPMSEDMIAASES
jgi:UDP-glucose 4-epimerase